MQSRNETSAAPKEDAVDGVLARLDALCQASEFFHRSPLEADGNTGHHHCGVALYRFPGPKGGGDPIKLAIFAGIHGDEAAGAHAVVRFVELLAKNPQLARGYDLHFYPVCNPSGFRAGTRHSASGKDLNREFWKGSSEPEVVFLEREIEAHAFHGLISLHADDTSDGMYGFARGAVLARSLVEPALRAAERALPRNRAAVIDGFAADNGVITECYEGILTASQKTACVPFELILETPALARMDKQVEAFCLCLGSILAEYQNFLAFAADL